MVSLRPLETALVYAALFLAEDVELVRLLGDKGRDGVAVRILIADPDCLHVAERGVEEGIGDVVAARVRNSRALLRPLLEAEGVHARQHGTVLYNSIFRADGEMLFNPQIHGLAAAFAPVFHLRELESGGMFSAYAESFERIWSKAASIDEK